MRQRYLMTALLAPATAWGIPNAAMAQFYKGKTVTMVVDCPAGGPADFALSLVDRAPEDFGKPIHEIVAVCPSG